MSKRSEKEDREQVDKAKPGFIPVAKTRGSRKGPAAKLDGGTPDTPELRSKSEELLKKFLPDAGSDHRTAGRARGVSAKPTEPASAKVKGQPRIVSVRPRQAPDSDEGVPPKDLQVVMDDEGQIGESS